jgi:hypothetical protein
LAELSGLAKSFKDKDTAVYESYLFEATRIALRLMATQLEIERLDLD